MSTERSGFTLAELLVTVSILALCVAVIGRFNAGQWRREQANAAATELASWLEEVSFSPEEDGLACTVTLSFVGEQTLAPGSVLATVAPSSCAREPVLRLPTLQQRQTYSVAASHGSWIFTPRGAVVVGGDAAAGGNNQEIQVGFSLAELPPSRCVRLTGSLGLIRLGRNNSSGNPSLPCSEWDTL